MSIFLPSIVSDGSGTSACDDASADEFESVFDSSFEADDELVLDDAVREIIFVDLTSGDAAAGFTAAKREFVVIADTEGGSVDAYTYTGTLKVKGERIAGLAKSTDNWQTCTFEEAE